MYQKKDLATQIEAAADKVKATCPMAPSITNSVTINFVANAQLAAGGSAAMIYLPDEGETLAVAGDSFYINVGTLSPIYAETLPRTAKALYDHQTPWVLDPVAVGIGQLRTDLLSQLKQYKPSIIRGNASEIIALAGLWQLSGGSDTSQVRGVETTDEVSAAERAAISLAQETGGAVAVSGEVDLITDGQQIVTSYGGSPLMEKITGSGCSLGGVAAVYAACTDPFTAACAASALYNVAGKKAAEKASATGSFQVAFIDELYLATPKEIAANPFELREVSL